MVDYPTAFEVIKKGDAGYLMIIILTLCACSLFMFFHHKFAGVRRTVDRFGGVALPLITLPLNVPIGILAGIAALIPRRISIPRHVDMVAVALAVGAVLRFPLLFDSLWYDEAFTVRLAGLNPSLWMNAIMSDIHPPLYYVLLSLWRGMMGDSPFMMRFPSYLLSLATIYLIYRVARDLRHTDTTAGIAALLVALMPASIYYGAEARAYALITVLVLLGLVDILERIPWLMFLIIPALCLTHHIGYFYTAALGFGGLVYHWRNRRFVLSMVAGGLVGMLWLPNMLYQSGHVADGHWIYITPGAAFWPLLNMTVGIIGQGFAMPVVIAVICITGVGLWRLRSWIRTREGLMWIVIVLGVPAADALVSFVWKPIYVYRHFLPATMLLMIAWAYVLTHSRLSRQIMAPVLVVSLISFYTYNLPASRPDYRTLLAERCEGADMFYATSITSAFITAENDPRPTLVWTGAKDNGRTLELPTVLNFNMPVGTIEDVAGHTVCIMQVDVPLAFQSERNYIQLLQLTNPHHTSYLRLSTWNDLYFHVIEVADNSCEPIYHCYGDNS